MQENYQGIWSSWLSLGSFAGQDIFKNNNDVFFKRILITKDFKVKMESLKNHGRHLRCLWNPNRLDSELICPALGPPVFCMTTLLQEEEEHMFEWKQLQTQLSFSWPAGFLPERRSITQQERRDLKELIRVRGPVRAQRLYSNVWEENKPAWEDKLHPEGRGSLLKILKVCNSSKCHFLELKWDDLEMKNSPNQRRANTHLSRRSSPTLLKEIFTSSSAHEHLTTATPPLPPPPPPPARLRPPFLWYPIGWQMIPKKIHHRKRFKDIRTHSARKWQHSWELGTKREARRGGGGGGGVLEGGIKKIKKSRERGRNPT